MGDLTRYFADFSERLVSLPTIEETMAAVVSTAVEVIDGCEHASLSQTRGKELVSVAHNDDLGPILDGIQTEEQEGPCLEAIRSGDVHTSTDLATDTRWRRYGPRAVAETSVRSSMAVPLRGGTGIIGALNLFADEVEVFGPNDPLDQVGLAAVVAAHAAPALTAALLREDMARALESRDVIGQAKGFLMARSAVGEDEAFEILVRASQRMNMKLAEVARRLVEGRLQEGS